MQANVLAAFNLKTTSKPLRTDGGIRSWWVRPAFSHALFIILKNPRSCKCIYKYNGFVKALYKCLFCRNAFFYLVPSIWQGLQMKMGLRGNVWHTFRMCVSCLIHVHCFSFRWIKLNSLPFVWISGIVLQLKWPSRGKSHCQNKTLLPPWHPPFPLDHHSCLARPPACQLLWAARNKAEHYESVKHSNKLFFRAQSHMKENYIWLKLQLQILTHRKELCF